SHRRDRSRDRGGGARPRRNRVRRHGAEGQGRMPHLQGARLRRHSPRGQTAARLSSMIATVNPATGETVRTFAEHTDGEIETRLARAAAAFRTWRRSAPADRSRLLARAAELLEADKARLGALMVLAMGKTRRAAFAEVEKGALACRYYAEHAAAHLADEKVAHGIVKYLPLGPVLAVMPWNFPFWQVFRFAAPALAAGNVGLLKHASNVPQ